jgi:oligopeptidase B
MNKCNYHQNGRPSIWDVDVAGSNPVTPTTNFWVLTGRSVHYMLSYSPYDNVTAQHYPAMLVLMSLWDSQVQYYEPTKWVARLRATKTDHEPLVFSVNMAGGHGGKSGRFERFHDAALEYAFILRQLKITE